MSKRVRVKPSKGQSMAGFFGGLIFCFIGFFGIIPIFGAFGLVWTLFAVIATVTSGINAFTDKGIATHEITIDDDVKRDAINHHRNTEDRMKELQSLYDKGLITGEEYEQKRKKILEDI